MAPQPYPAQSCGQAQTTHPDGPIIGSKLELESVFVMRVDLLTDDRTSKLACCILTQPFVGRGDADPCPAGRSEDRIGDAVVFESHAILEHK